MSKRSIKKSIDRKQKGNNKNSKNYYNDEAKKLGIIIGVILLIFIVAYLIIGIFVTKEIKWFQGDNEKVTTIQYKEILAGETFNQNKENYYVIFTDSDDFNYPVYETLATNNKNVYLVDLSNALNSSYISEQTNPNVQKASDLKVQKDTMIKIENKTNTLYIESKDEILTRF